MKTQKRKPVKTKAEKKSTLSQGQIHFYLFSIFSILVLPVLYAKNALDPSLMLRLLGINIFLLAAMIYVFITPGFVIAGISILRQRIFYLLLAYFLITLFSMFFAVNYKESFFDISKTYAMLLFTAYASLIFTATPDWLDKLPKFVIVSALIACGIGFFQYYNYVIMATVDALPNGDPIIYRVKGLMSHKNVYAISLLLMLPFTGFGIYKFRKSWRFLSILAAILILVLIFLLRTRSVWVGLIFSTGVSVGILILYGKSFNVPGRVRLSLFIGIFIALSVVAALFVAGKHFDNIYIRQLRTITNPKASNNMFRIKIWDMSTKMVADHPLTGVGAGNWKIISPYYYEGYNFEKNQLNWIRPHNDYLWVVTEKGIIGFLVFLGIFVLTFYYMFKIFLSGTKTEYKVFSLCMLAGLLSYLSDSTFSFPLERIEIQVYLAIILASTVVIYNTFNSQKGFKINKFLFIIPVIILLSISIAYSYSALNLEFKVKRARIAHLRSDWKGLLTEAKSINTFFRDLDAEAMPVEWYYGLAYASLNDNEKSKEHYLKAFKANPTKISILNNLGQIYFKEGQYNEAKEWFNKALSILPDYLEANVNLSATYYKLGEYENALETLNNIPVKQRDERINKNMVSIEKLIRQQKEKNSHN